VQHDNQWHQSGRPCCQHRQPIAAAALCRAARQRQEPGSFGHRHLGFGQRATGRHPAAGNLAQRFGQRGLAGLALWFAGFEDLPSSQVNLPSMTSPAAIGGESGRSAETAEPCSKLRIIAVASCSLPTRVSLATSAWPRWIVGVILGVSLKRSADAVAKRCLARTSCLQCARNGQGANRDAGLGQRADPGQWWLTPAPGCQPFGYHAFHPVPACGPVRPARPGAIPKGYLCRSRPAERYLSARRPDCGLRCGAGRLGGEWNLSRNGGPIRRGSANVCTVGLPDSA